MDILIDDTYHPDVEAEWIEGERMRVSQQEKEKTHQRIVKSAARLLRERGLENTGVDDVMRDAGLTHGGFYRHFETKDTMVGAALDLAFEQILAALDAGLAKNSPQQALSDFAAHYLSAGHVAHPGIGCPVPALSSEIGRASASVRERFSAGVRRLGDALGRGLRGSAAQRRARAYRQLAMMAGAVMIARASDQATAAEVLAACRAPTAGAPPLSGTFPKLTAT